MKVIIYLLKQKSFLNSYFDKLLLHKDKYFGNARTVRKIVLEVIKNQNLRVAKIAKKNRKKGASNKVSFDDVQGIENMMNQESYKRKGIGY